MQMKFVNKATQSAILEAVDGMPPSTWWDLCQTNRQKEHYQDIRTSFQLIYVGLKEYFRGQPSTLDSELALATVDYYVSLYGVIQRGWHHIVSVVQTHKIAKFPETPGGAMSALIEDDCATFFAPCLEAHEWSKDTAYRFYLEEKKVRALLTSGNPLTKPEKAKVERFSVKLQQMQRTYKDLLRLRNFCLAVCRSVEGDHALQHKLEAFDKSQLYLHSLIGPNLRKSESYRWNGEGNKISGTRSGGVYN
jgi:hypothetical protein